MSCGKVSAYPNSNFVNNSLVWLLLLIFPRVKEIGKRVFSGFPDLDPGPGSGTSFYFMEPDPSPGPADLNQGRSWGLHAWTASVLSSWTPKWMECAKNESDFFRFMACDYGYDEEARNRLIDQAKLVGMFAFLFFIVLATRRGSDQQGSIFNFRTCPGALLSKIKGAPQEERIYSFEEALAANPILGMALHNASVNPQSVARGSLIFCSIDGYECYVPRAAYNEIAREYHFQEEIK